MFQITITVLLLWIYGGVAMRKTHLPVGPYTVSDARYNIASPPRWRKVLVPDGPTDQAPQAAPSEDQAPQAAPSDDQAPQQAAPSEDQAPQAAPNEDQAAAPSDGQAVQAAPSDGPSDGQSVETEGNPPLISADLDVPRTHQPIFFTNANHSLRKARNGETSFSQMVPGFATPCIIDYTNFDQWLKGVGVRSGQLQTVITVGQGPRMIQRPTDTSPRLTERPVSILPTFVAELGLLHDKPFQKLKKRIFEAIDATLDDEIAESEASSSTQPHRPPKRDRPHPTAAEDPDKKDDPRDDTKDLSPE